MGINQNLDSYNPITKIYPIPFNNNIIININLLENSNVEFNIENVLSQTIVKSYYNNLPAGIHNEVLSLPENISSGLYNIRIIIDGRMYIRKIIKE